MLFKLNPKVGSHVERDSKGVQRIYNAGDIVESNQDLAKLFVGKFVRVDRDIHGAVPYIAPNIPTPNKGIKLEQAGSLSQSSDTNITEAEDETEAEAEDETEAETEDETEDED